MRRVVVPAGVLALVVGMCAMWEGYRPTPYQDIVGVWTVCYGETHNVEQRRYSRAECQEMLKGRLAESYGHVKRCIHVPLKDNEAASLTDAVYNLGPAIVCGSTLQRLANAGEPAEVWCRQLLRWNRAGGRVVLGLTRRRQDEYRMCVGAE